MPKVGLIIFIPPVDLPGTPLARGKLPHCRNYIINWVNEKEESLVIPA
jgi:hypothetical protein